MRRALPILAVTAIAVLLGVPATYSVLRAYDVLFRGEPDPATVVWSSPHIAMFWRLAVGGYMAAMIGPVAYVAARRDLRRTVKTLEVLLVVVAGMLGVQGLALP
jgi:hypothetical protein